MSNNSQAGGSDVNTSALSEANNGDDSASIEAQLTEIFLAEMSEEESNDGDQSAAEPNIESSNDHDQGDDAGTEDPKGSDESQTSEAKEQGSDDDQDDTFKAIEGNEKEFIDSFDDLKAKYLRDASNQVLTEMAEYGAAAKRGNEVITKLGGEEFIPGLTTISEALRSGDPRALFRGIEETASAEELLKVQADSIYIGLVKASEMAQSEDPASAAYGQALTQLIDHALQERFGEHVTSERLEKLALWAEAGWFEKIEKWTEDEYVDREELEELLKSTQDPDLRAASKRIKELEAQLGQKEVKGKEESQVSRGTAEKSFSDMVSGQIKSVLTDRIWKNTPLAENASDSAELKQEKALIRQTLTGQAVDAFQASDAKSKLLNDYVSGKSNSAVFKAELVKALNQAILATKEPTTTANRMLAKLYGSTRNAQLAQQRNRGQSANNERESREPSGSRDFGGEKKERSREDILASLTQDFASLS